MDIGYSHKNNKQGAGMLINDLLYLLTVGGIVNETVLINKHHTWRKGVTCGGKFVNRMYIVDLFFLYPSAGQIPG